MHNVVMGVKYGLDAFAVYLVHRNRGLIEDDDVRLVEEIII